MKMYDAKCPLCGTVNHSLYLDETDGYMECEHCRETLKVQEFVNLVKLPIYDMNRIPLSRVSALA